VEYYAAENQHNEPTVAEPWMALSGTPIIPFEQTERRTLLPNAYERLEPHIDLWRAKIAKDLSITDDGSSDAEEALDAEDGMGPR
jgi:hypothetical protein